MRVFTGVLYASIQSVREIADHACADPCVRVVALIPIQAGKELVEFVKCPDSVGRYLDMGWKALNETLQP